MLCCKMGCNRLDPGGLGDASLNLLTGIGCLMTPRECICAGMPYQLLILISLITDLTTVTIAPTALYVDNAVSGECGLHGNCSRVDRSDH